MLKSTTNERIIKFIVNRILKRNLINFVYSLFFIYKIVPLTEDKIRFFVFLINA